MHMGSGLSWLDEEAMNLTRAWVAEIEDHITGIDQTTALFTETLHKKHAIIKPTDDKSTQQ